MYEITKPIGHSMNGDLEYYTDKLKTIGGTVLEAGVGTGRMMIPLLKEGIDVEGIDLSNEMLDQCRKNLKIHGLEGSVFQGDLTTFNANEKYEAIIMPTGSFCLLPKAIIEDVLTSFYKSLQGGGKLILDLELPSWFVQGEVSIQDFSLENNTGLLFTSTAKEIDWHKQYTSYIHRYEWIENGNVKGVEVSNFTLYWYGINEFELLLEKCGFRDIQMDIGYGINALSSLVTFQSIK